MGTDPPAEPRRGKKKKHGASGKSCLDGAPPAAGSGVWPGPGPLNRKIRVSYRRSNSIPRWPDKSVYLASDAGLTLFSGFSLPPGAVLLSRYSNQNDLVVGVPVSGRDVSRTRKGNRIIFVKYVAASAGSCRDKPRFEDLVRDCLGAFLYSLPNPRLPFDAILDAVRPERTHSHSPLFQVVLNYLREGGAGLHLPGLHLEDTTVTKVPFHNGTSLFDLTLTVFGQVPSIALHSRI